MAFTHLRPTRRPDRTRWNPSVACPASSSLNEIVVPSFALAMLGSAGPRRQRLAERRTLENFGAVLSGVPLAFVPTWIVTVASGESDTVSLPR